MKLSFKTILPILLIFTLLILFTGCFITPSPGYTPPTYTVTYNGNTNTGGVVPTDANHYEQGVSVTVLAPGSLVKTGYTFGGWNTAADGLGTIQVAGSSFNMGTANVTLYAQWTANPTYTPPTYTPPTYTPPTYTVTTAVDPASSGTVTGAGTYNVGTVVTITANPASGYQFVNWTGAVTGSVNPTTVTIDADKTVTANFALITHDLTMAVSPADGGTTTPAVGVHNYNAWTVVGITATPALGYQFVNWTGAVTGSTVTMDADKTVIANFEAITYTLTVGVNPADSALDVVAITPLRGAYSGYAYNSTETVSIDTATIPAGWQFVNWTDSVGGTEIGTGPTGVTVTMNADKTVTANFALKKYTLTTSVDPTESGTVTGAGSYNAGETVNITATANIWPYVFVNWTGDVTTVANVNSANTTIVMNSNKSVTANFKPWWLYDLTMAANPPAGGSVSGAGTYNVGTMVTISATPALGYKFVNWTVSAGAAVANPNSASTTVTMDADKTVTANFELITHDLTMAVSPADGGTTTPAVGVHNYTVGTVVTITANPASDYQFVNWTGAVTGSVNPTTVTMDADKTVTANFELNPPALTIVAGSVGSGKVTITSNYGDVVTGSTVATFTSGGTTWKNLGNKLQARVTTTFPDHMTRLVLTPTATTNVVTITGREQTGENISPTTLTVEVRDKIDNTITKSFTVDVSRNGSGNTLIIGTITVL